MASLSFRVITVFRLEHLICTQMLQELMVLVHYLAVTGVMGNGPMIGLVIILPSWNSIQSFSVFACGAICLVSMCCFSLITML